MVRARQGPTSRGLITIALFLATVAGCSTAAEDLPAKSPTEPKSATSPAAPVTPSATSTPADAAAKGEVLALIELQGKLFRRHSWAEMYETISPEGRQACSKEDFVQLMTLAYPDELDLSLVKVSGLVVRIDGEFAYVTYAVTAGTLYSVVDESNPDVFVRLGGRWYDELDDSLFAACQA